MMFNAGQDNLKKYPLLCQRIKAVLEWCHYDNFQTGEYQNENSMGYGPILVHNSTIEISIGKYFFVHHCDLSPPRQSYLIDLHNDLDADVCIHHEYSRGMDSTIYQQYTKDSDECFGCGRSLDPKFLFNGGSLEDPVSVCRSCRDRVDQKFDSLAWGSIVPDESEE